VADRGALMNRLETVEVRISAAAAARAAEAVQRLEVERVDAAERDCERGRAHGGRLLALVPRRVVKHAAVGGEGALAAASALIAACEKSPRPRAPQYAYELTQTVEEKITAVATRIYGAERVEFGAKARTDLKTIAELGLAGLPICIAKTQYSFSDQPGLLGRPRGFTFVVREIEIVGGGRMAAKRRVVGLR
jgi:formyltetrahydrofolate synthetase